MTSPTTPPPTVADTDVALDAAGAIAVDVPCRRCGYNLRGLSPAGRCPECGQSIADSLIGDALHVADPAWLRQVVGGAWLIFWGILLTLFTLLIPIGVGSLLGLPMFMLLPLLLPCIAVGMLGVWRLTAREPGRPVDCDGLWSRRVARCGPVIILALLLAAGLTSSAAIPWLRAFPPLAFAAAVPTTWIALLVHVRRLAGRVPDDKLAGHCILVAGLVGLAAVLTVITALLSKSAASGTAGHWLPCLTEVLAVYMALAAAFGTSFVVATAAESFVTAQRGTADRRPGAPRQ
jgi:hypothetical protein